MGSRAASSWGSPQQPCRDVLQDGDAVFEVHFLDVRTGSGVLFLVHTGAGTTPAELQAIGIVALPKYIEGV